MSELSHLNVNHWRIKIIVNVRDSWVSHASNLTILQLDLYGLPPNSLLRIADFIIIQTDFDQVIYKTVCKVLRIICLHSNDLITCDRCYRDERRAYNKNILNRVLFV